MLLQRVGDVARAANAVEPTTVTQRAFDAERQRAKCFSDVPTARATAHKLRLGWQEIMELAQEPVPTQKRRLAKKEGEGREEWLTEEHVAAMLGIVAARLGTDSLTREEYAAEREQILAENKQRARQTPIPTVDQIRRVARDRVPGDKSGTTSYAGSWERALRLAGLKPRAKPKLKIVGVASVELLERAYKAHGTQLTGADLEVFARANNIPHRRDHKRPWEETVAEWKRNREDEGLPVPAGPPPLAERPDYSKDVGAALPGERRSAQWTAVACVAALADYVEQLPPGQRAGIKHYRAWQTGRTHTPYFVTLRQHGGWAKLLAAAHAEVARRHKQAGP